MNRVLLTGATGFVGRACIPALVRRGYEIHGIYHQTTEASKLAANVRWHQLNLLDLSAVKQLIVAVKPSHLLHLAWYVNPKSYWTSTENFRWVHATLALWEAFAEQGGQRMVSTGTCAEYSWDNGFCSEQETLLRPNTVYGNCKAALSMLSSAIGRSSGMSSAWARLFYLYGNWEDPARLIPSVIESLLADKVALCTSGEQIRDYLYVEDAANALIALLESNIEGAVNIASGIELKVRDLISIVANQMNRLSLVQFGAIQAPANDPPRIAADISRLRNEVGWTPDFSLEDGLSNTIKWWREKR